MSKITEDKLTEMEGLALGLVKTLQPASAYALAAAFAQSPSAFWSGSAGAVYPLVKRLAKAGYISGEKARTGKRKSTLYRLTPSGNAMFRDWLLDVERAINPGFDPLRSRMSMIHLVSPQKRDAFLANVETALHDTKTDPLSAKHSTERFRALHNSWLKQRLAWLGRLKALIAAGKI